MNNNPTHNAIINNIISLTDDSKLFTIKLPSIDFTYRPGQFVVIVLFLQNKEYRRSYSIVTFDAERHTLSFLVKRIDNGMVSRILVDDFQIGDTLYIDSINGFFTLPNPISDYQQVFFLAAGSGITPIIPMIHQLLREHSDIKINLLYSSKKANTTLFYQEIQEWAQRQQVEVDYLFSETGNIGSSRLTNTLLTQYLHTKVKAPFAQCLFFTCGPLEYMDTVTITLLTEGVPKSHIKKEIFFNHELDALPEPEDKEQHAVTIKLANGISHHIQVQYPNSILSAAQDEGIRMPYSCGSGQCGSCTAKIISGKVWMSYNEVLTDKELDEGYTLTCLGYPIGGPVTLEFM